MGEFVEFAKKYGADVVEFQKLGNWGTFSEQEYLQRNVFNPNHELYKEAMSLLESIIHKENKIQIMQNVL